MEKLKTAVIIAGGEGTRLQPITNEIPKALVPVNGKPILYWSIKWLKEQGIKNIVIGTAYKREKIIEYIKENNNFGLKIQFSKHTVKGGTAQAFKQALKLVKDKTFVALNCDEITNMDLLKLFNIHQKQKQMITMALAPFHCRFSVVDVTKNNMISTFKYGHKLDNILVSIGIYIFNKEIFKHIKSTGSIEDDTFVKLVQQKKVAYYKLLKNEEWISVNTHKDIKDAEKLMKRLFK